uniref:uncharacterized protein LOC120328400 n=1 Tax=Styela clava TaxID=7725 RepID=UPI00193A5A38|nr:uncharacterized protein LOC120328400 [Styela clava]
MNRRYRQTRKQQHTFRNIIGIILSVHVLFGFSAEPEVVDGSGLEPNATRSLPETPNSTSLFHPGCSGSYWVGSKAKLLSIPRNTNNEPVHCRWLLKADDVHNTIGLSTVNTTFSMDEDIDYYFKLDARDGWKDDSPLISSLEWSDGFVSMDWAFLKPAKATSGFLLLEYKNKGNNPLQMDFVYFTCGGYADSKTYISSPVFTGLPLKPEIVDCQWVFTRPKDTLYGYLRTLEVNISDCEVLQMRSNSSMQIIYEKVDATLQTDLEIYSTTVNRTANPGALENFITWAKEQANLTSIVDSNIDKPKNRTIASICGNSTKMIVFQSAIAKLRYLSTGGNARTGFKALYSTFKLPDRWESRRMRKIPWFYTYSTLVVFVPIGLVSGIIIILYSSRRRGPDASASKMSSKLFNSPGFGKNGRRAASFHSQCNFRLGSFIKLPIRRSKSLTNIKPLSSEFSSKQDCVLKLQEEKTFLEEFNEVDEIPHIVQIHSVNSDVQVVNTRPGILRKLSQSTNCVANNNNNNELFQQLKLKDGTFNSKVKQNKKQVKFTKSSLVTDGTQTL